MRQIEILAPAGSIEGMKAAINASCDAVYIGGSQFGARAYAENPDEDQMLYAIDYAHLHNKRIYLTVNTLLKNQEIEEKLYRYLNRFYEQGLDAVIVQDVGVMYYIHKHFPGLAIHASTQMTLTMAQGAEVLKEFGVTRVVNSRELSLDEIKLMRKDTSLEIESFVHGALCYCYSGQCLMSSMIGGRSGNRGRCAQPCRMPYQLMGSYSGSPKKIISKPEEKYLLSPKDICTLDMIPDLIDAGIDSFKIEGRMKRPEYAAGVTHIYRKYVNRYLESGRERYESYLNDHKDELKRDLILLQDLYNRGGFSSGYYNNKNGKIMLSLNRPNHSGVYVGEVKAVKANQAYIHLVEPVNPQDILEIRDSAGDLYEFTVKYGELAGKDYSINLGKNLKVKAGNSVFRTKNNLLLENIAEHFVKEEKKEYISGQLIAKAGDPIKLILSCRDNSIEITGERIEEAKNQPMSEEKIRKQLLKTNDTPYLFEKLTIDLDGAVFIPVQKLNELRRDGLSALANAVAVSYHRKRTGHNLDRIEDISDKMIINNGDVDNGLPGISAQVASEEQMKAACSHAEVTNIYLNSECIPLDKILDLSRLCRHSNKKCYILMPHIFRNSVYQLFLQHKRVLEDNTIDGYIIQNFEEYEFVKKQILVNKPEKDIITNYNQYVMNGQAMRFWNQMGITKFTAPLELNLSELKELAGRYSDFIVYGRIPLMVTAQCIVKTTLDCNAKITELELTDRFQKRFPVKRNCQFCYNTIYNSQCLSLLQNVKEVKSLQPKNIRLDFTFESYEETDRLLNAFIQAYLYNNPQKEVLSDYTRGHFKRGVE